MKRLFFLVSMVGWGMVGLSSCTPPGELMRKTDCNAAIDPSCAPPTADQSPATTVTILYVDPATGNDGGTGSADQPFKTIRRSLEQATPGTTIQLRPGVYSADRGESFPIQLKPGITLEGAAQSQGKDIQITGGGKFLSPTWAGQSVTIVAARDSRIVGLSLTNPNPRGTAIWVEAGAPTIEQNRFVGSDRDGVFVSGTATPTIRNNLFEQNSGNGISFTRDSGGLAEGNQIRNSGTGVAISERATPRLVKNSIAYHKDGVVIVGDANAVLRANEIENNGRDGVVVTTRSRLTLEQNTFADNGQYDIHSTSSQPLNGDGAELARLKVESQVKF